MGTLKKRDHEVLREFRFDRFERNTYRRIRALQGGENRIQRRLGYIAQRAVRLDFDRRCHNAVSDCESASEEVGEQPEEQESTDFSDDFDGECEEFENPDEDEDLDESEDQDESEEMGMSMSM